MTGFLRTLHGSMALLEITSEDSKLFALDMGLLIQAAFVLISTFVLFMLLGYLLFDPVRAYLEKRTEKIKGDIAQAADIKQEALSLKASYEEKLTLVDQKAEKILSDSRKKALEKEREIVARAEDEAARIIKRAHLEIEREKEQIKDDIRKEVISVATVMASKFVAASLSQEQKHTLVSETIEQMGADTWLS